MRADGALSTASGLASGSHVCWVYDDPDCFAAAGRAYLADGLAHGDRVLCVGPLADEAVRSGIGGHGYDELAARGALRVLDVDEVYDDRAPLDPRAQLAAYDAMTRDAVADGYRGLRVLAEVTTLVTDPRRRPAHLRWEHLADGYMATGAGLSALCAYRRAGIGEAAAADLESMHPLVRARAGTPPFRLFFDDERLALAGVVDAFAADRLLRALTESHVEGPEVVLDLARLEFVDVRGCTVLASYADSLARREWALRVVGAPPMFRRVWQVLGYDGLANATVAGALR